MRFLALRDSSRFNFLARDGLRWNWRRLTSGIIPASTTFRENSRMSASSDLPGDRFTNTIKNTPFHLVSVKLSMTETGFPSYFADCVNKNVGNLTFTFFRMSIVAEIPLSVNLKSPSSVINIVRFTLATISILIHSICSLTYWRWSL